jgi:hypothetical protein
MRRSAKKDGVGKIALISTSLMQMSLERNFGNIFLVCVIGLSQATTCRVLAVAGQDDVPGGWSPRAGRVEN